MSTTSGLAHATQRTRGKDLILFVGDQETGEGDLLGRVADLIVEQMTEVLDVASLTGYGHAFLVRCALLSVEVQGLQGIVVFVAIVVLKETARHHTCSALKVKCNPERIDTHIRCQWQCDTHFACFAMDDKCAVGHEF